MQGMCLFCCLRPRRDGVLRLLLLGLQGWGEEGRARTEGGEMTALLGWGRKGTTPLKLLIFSPVIWAR